MFVKRNQLLKPAAQYLNAAIFAFILLFHCNYKIILRNCCEVLFCNQKDQHSETEKHYACKKFRCRNGPPGKGLELFGFDPEKHENEHADKRQHECCAISDKIRYRPAAEIWKAYHVCYRRKIHLSGAEKFQKRYKQPDSERENRYIP